MDADAFETFLVGQEIALKAVLTSGTQIEPKEIRKSIDKHIARTNRIVRNVLPPVENPAHAPPTPLKKSTPKSNPSAATSLSHNGKFKTPTPLKPGQRFGGATTLFGSRRSGTSSGGKHARIESGSSSAGSPPESPIMSCKKMRARRRESAPTPSPTLIASLAAGMAQSAGMEKKVTQVRDIAEGYGIRDLEDWDVFGEDVV